MEKYTPIVHSDVNPTAKKLIGGLSIALVASLVVLCVVVTSSPQVVALQALQEYPPDDVQTVLAPSGTVPIYRYYAINGDGSGWRFLFSRNSNVGSGWTSQGAFFYGYAAPYANSAPVYQYYKILSDGSGWSFHYSLSTSVGQGWTIQDVLAYVFSYQASGTVPFYSYYAYNRDGTARYFYSSKSNEGQGWTYEKVAFYAYTS